MLWFQSKHQIRGIAIVTNKLLATTNSNSNCLIFVVSNMRPSLLTRSSVY